MSTGVILASVKELDFAWSALITACMANLFAAFKVCECMCARVYVYVYVCMHACVRVGVGGRWVGECGYIVM